MCVTITATSQSSAMAFQCCSGVEPMLASYTDHVHVSYSVSAHITGVPSMRLPRDQAVFSLLCPGLTKNFALTGRSMKLAANASPSTNACVQNELDNQIIYNLYCTSKEFLDLGQVSIAMFGQWLQGNY